jgi:hypothetical protein
MWKEVKNFQKICFLLLLPCAFGRFCVANGLGAAGVLVLVPKAAIRIIQCSAGAISSGGNKKSPNRRQQQQKNGEI